MLARVPPAILAALWICATALSAAPPPILKLDDVRPGMRGVGKTTFEGTRVAEFEVEVVGVLREIGPDQDLILARCTGGPLAETRILSGMSGSPVFIDGRLIGAIAYSWGFSTDSIAGITPIEEMLAVAARDRAAGSARQAATGPFERLGPDLDADVLAEFFRSRWASAFAPGSAGIAPLTLPVSIAGLPPAGFAALAPVLGNAGFLAVQGGSGAAAAGSPPPLEPGSAIGVKLVRGDVEIAATGTVTWVDGDRILAFGHPLFGLGDVDFPMTAARVEALLPSLMQSARLATPLAEVGALRQDRPSAVAGALGAGAAMIPVRLQYQGADGVRASYAFDLVADPVLAPVLLYYTLNGVLAGRDRAVGSLSLRLAEGSVIRLRDEGDIALDNVFSGTTATAYATGIGAFVLHLLLNNAWSPPRVEGINLILEYASAPRAARIRRVTLDRYRARPGDAVRASVVLQPYRGPDVVVEREIRIPDETPPGTLTLTAGSADAVSRPEAGEEPVAPRDLQQFVFVVNNLRRNDRVYVVAGRDDDGALVGGARLPNLPPSAAAVLTRPATHGNVTIIRRRGILEDSIPTQYAVEGSARIELEVEAP